MRNFVILSFKRPFSLDKIISSMSPFSFSMTTKMRSDVSNIPCRFTTLAWARFCRIETSFLSWASCLVGNRSLSITLIATARPDFLWIPEERFSCTCKTCNVLAHYYSFPEDTTHLRIRCRTAPIPGFRQGRFDTDDWYRRFSHLFPGHRHTRHFLFLQTKCGHKWNMTAAIRAKSSIRWSKHSTGERLILNHPLKEIRSNI